MLLRYRVDLTFDKICYKLLFSQLLSLLVVYVAITEMYAYDPECMMWTDISSTFGEFFERNMLQISGLPKQFWHWARWT